MENVKDELVAFKQRFSIITDNIYANLILRILSITVLLLIFIDIVFWIFPGMDNSTDVDDNIISINLISLIRNTLYWGSLYLSIAMGLTMTYKLLRFPNFAHAEYMVVGGFSAIFLSSTKYFQEGSTLSILLLPIGLIAAIIGGGAIAVIADLLVFRPLRRKNATIETIMISSLGLSLVLRGLLLLRFTNDNQSWIYSVHPSVKNNISQRNFELNSIVLRFGYGKKRTSIDFDRVFIIKLFDIFVVLTIMTVVLLVILFVNRTKLGKAMRAVADNSDLAAASGINIDQINLMSAFIGGALAGIAGALFAGSVLAFRPETGIIFLLPAFAVMVLGSTGSLQGAVIASYIMGFGRSISEPILGGLAGSLDTPALTTYRDIVPFVLLIIILLFSSRGIGESIEEKNRAKYNIEDGVKT